MLRDLSLSLRALLTQGAADYPELATAHVAFDRPGENFNPSQPTISLYLYDIRENTELRSTEPRVDIVNGQAMLRRPALRVACTYLVTAWPGNVAGDERALGEQRLLSQVLAVFWANPKLPAGCLVGSLASQVPQVPLITAQAEGLRNPSEFWTALNNSMRPSLNVGVTIAMQPAQVAAAPLVTSSGIIVRHDRRPADTAYRIGGVVSIGTVAADGAEVTMDPTGQTARTDAAGRYVLGPVPGGTYTLNVRHGMLQKAVPAEIPATAANAYDIQMN